IDTEDTRVSEHRDGLKDAERQIAELAKLNREDVKRLKQIDTIVSQANREVNIIDQLLALEKKKAVLEFQLQDYKSKQDNDLSVQIAEFETRKELLEDALQALKEHRAKEDQDVLENF